MKPFRWAFFVALLALLTACSTPAEHLWLKSPAWSRALRFGETGIAQPVALQVADDGRACTFLFPADREQGTYSLEIRCLLPDGEVQTTPLDWTLKRPQRSALRMEADGYRLWWTDAGQLYTALTGSDGSWLDAPRKLDLPLPVDDFLVVDGGLLVSGTRRTPGVGFWSEEGGWVPLAEDGVWLRGMPDASGNWHLAWVTYPLGSGRSALYYAFRPVGAGWDALQPVEVRDLPLGNNVRLESLALAADDSHVSIFWTTSIVAGLEAGTVTTQFVSSPAGKVQFSAAQSPVVPVAYEGAWQDVGATDLQSGPRLFAPGGTDALEDLFALPTPSDEQVLAYRTAMLHHWRKMRWQVNLLYLDGGQPNGVQPLSFTPSYSLYPVVARDASGYLTVAWLEKISSDAYEVYLTSTHPAVVASQASLTWAERGDIAVQVLFGMLVGALLAPLAASVWMLAPLFVFLLVNALRRWLPAAWRERWELVSLGLALLAAWGAKSATLPAIFTYVPFSAWIPNIPPMVGDLLRYGVPVLIFLLSGGVAWHYTYRRKSQSALYFLLIYIAVDALLSMSVYAVMIYGVF
jgi:hypothetical protein